jgi:Porin subfamily
MKLVKSLLFASVACLIATAQARAADLWQAPATPYVRICDANGAGFFLLPGTDTCLKIGGLLYGETRLYSGGFKLNNAAVWANGIKAGTIPSLSQFQPAGANTLGAEGFGSVEFDARTPTPYGDVRTFARFDTIFGFGSTASTGILSTAGGAAFDNPAASQNLKDVTFVDKAFIQFAGLTAGRAQSMFDFYADAYNWEGLRGSNATTQLLAYTALLGNGFSATLSLEDPNARRGNIGSVNAGDQAAYTGPRAPDIVGNLRLDQSWGSLQVTGAGHEVRTDLFASPATGVPNPMTLSSGTSDDWGFAAQAGVSFNLPALNPGDQLWLQATYEKGAVGYITGNNLAYTSGSANPLPGYGNGISEGLNSGVGWDPQYAQDCTWTAAGRCEQQSGFSLTGALKHYWTPNLSSAMFGSYMEQHYADDALAGFGGAIGPGNLKEVRAGTNLIWSPILGLDIGGEFMYERLSVSMPAGLVSNPTLNGAGLPNFQPMQNLFEGRIRVQKAF